MRLEPSTPLSRVKHPTTEPPRTPDVIIVHFTRTKKYLSGIWSATEQNLHINFLEIKAAFLALKIFCSTTSDKHVKLFLDNQVALKYLQKMGRGNLSSISLQNKFGNGVKAVTFGSQFTIFLVQIILLLTGSVGMMIYNVCYVMKFFR